MGGAVSSLIPTTATTSTATSTRDQRPSLNRNNSVLITAAIEALNRRRLFDQLRSLEAEAEGQNNNANQPQSPGGNHRRLSGTAPQQQQQQQPRGVHYFSSLAELFCDLLERNELQLSLPRSGDLNMQQEQQQQQEEASITDSDREIEEDIPMGEDSESESEAELEPIATRSSTRASTRTLTKTSIPSKAFALSTSPPLAKSYSDLLNDVRMRCGVGEGGDASVEGQPLIKLLDHRSLGPSQQCCGLSPAQQVNLSNRYLPNRRWLVDKVKAKTFCVGYMQDGALMTASQDHRIRLYQAGGQRQRYRLRSSHEVPCVGWSILDVAVSPDGRDIVYSTWHDTIYQCTLADQSTTWTPMRIEEADDRFALFSIRFNSSGTEIVAGSSDEHVYIYHREVGRCVLSVKAHEDDVNSVCFADQSSHIICTGSDDGLCKVWDRRTMGDFSRVTPVGVFAGHRDGIVFIDARGDDRYLLTNSKDQTIKLWDLRRFADDKAVTSTKRAVSHQRWDYRWQTPYYAGVDTTRLEGDCSLATIRGHSVMHTLIRARFSPDHTGKRFIYTGCGRGNCLVYDIITGEQSKIYTGHASVIRDCMWHPDTNEIATTSWDGCTYVWRFDQRSLPCNEGEEDAFSCDENYKPLTIRKVRGRKRLA